MVSPLRWETEKNKRGKAKAKVLGKKIKTNKLD